MSKKSLIVLCFLAVTLFCSRCMAEENITVSPVMSISKEQAIAIGKKLATHGGKVSIDGMEFEATFVPNANYKEAFQQEPVIHVSKDFEDNTGIVSPMKEKPPKKSPTGDKNGYWYVTYAPKGHEKLKYPESNWGVGMISIDSKTGEYIGPFFIG